MGLESEIKAVLTPPINVVLPAKPLTITVNAKAIMFIHLSRAELVDICLLTNSYFQCLSIKNLAINWISFLGIIVLMH